MYDCLPPLAPLAWGDRRDRAIRARQPRPERSGVTPRRFEPEQQRPGKVTVDLDHDLLEEMRDAVIHLSGPPHRMTIRSLIEGALRNELRRLREELLDGAPFPAREHELRAGRPPR